MVDNIDVGFKSKFGPFDKGIWDDEEWFKTIFQRRITASVKKLGVRTDLPPSTLSYFNVPTSANNLKILNLQLDPTRVICSLGKDSLDSSRELRVQKIIKHGCTMYNSRLDFSCMSACGNHLLAFAEAKKEASNMSTQISTRDIQQLAAYMFSALAYSHWGGKITRGDEPISALLIYPTKIFRLSMWKSKTFLSACTIGSKSRRILS
jgi:hypothetical protein